MALDAYDEMKVDNAQYGYGKTKRPSVATVLAVDNDVYIATSSKGGAAFQKRLPNSPVSQSLIRCSMIFKDRTQLLKEHKNNGKCGEMSCAHLYYQTHPGVLDMRGKGARAITAGASYQDETITTPLDPCSGRDVSNAHELKSHLMT